MKVTSLKNICQYEHIPQSLILWSSIRSLSSLHGDEIINEFLLGWIHLRMFDHSPTSDVLFLLIEMRLFKNFSHHHHIRQCLIIDEHPMSFFYSSKWDHWTISLIIKTFANVWSLTNIRCPFSLHRDEIIEQFLWRWTHLPMFNPWATSDVPFGFIEIRSLKNLSRMNTYANVWSLTNIRCPFSLHRDEIIEEFLSASSHSPVFYHLPTSDVLFLFMEMRSLKNFSYDEYICECLIIHQHPMSFFSWSRWDYSRISLSIITFANVWSLTNMRCCFFVAGGFIIKQLFWRWTNYWMFNPWPTCDVLFSLSRWDRWRIFLRMKAFPNVSSLTDIRCPSSFYRD